MRPYQRPCLSVSFRALNGQLEVLRRSRKGSNNGPRRGGFAAVDLLSQVSRSALGENDEPLVLVDLCCEPSI